MTRESLLVPHTMIFRSRNDRLCSIIFRFPPGFLDQSADALFSVRIYVHLCTARSRKWKINGEPKCSSLAIKGWQVNSNCWLSKNKPLHTWVGGETCVSVRRRWVRVLGLGLGLCLSVHAASHPKISYSFRFSLRLSFWHYTFYYILRLELFDYYLWKWHGGPGLGLK